MVLVSAILRAITRVLNSKAVEDNPEIEELLENPALLRQDINEPDIIEDVKLEPVRDEDEAMNTRITLN